MEIVTPQGQPASILGLAGQQQMDATCVSVAFEALINYFFFYDLKVENFLDGLKSLLGAKREQVLIATGSEDRDIISLRNYLNCVRDRLNINGVDVFFVEYVSPSDDINQVCEVLEALRYWKDSGILRYVGVTTHNRRIAKELIESGQCDVLMHRYNMAHRKVQEDVLPAAQSLDVPVVAFTCTRWGSLLKGHPDWQAEPPTAADCYRYVLHHPAVRLALTAPQTTQQLEQNLSVLHAPPLSSQEATHWQKYGDLIYGNGQDAFETQWE
ncbi:aldo/keto reductase [Dendronalium sp. ChiSLP03b]|uniref:aldo/keto reductase n=1 Tax=Dendronalium sp. ChiSLP03b TaxID=3075381 RepID=UPI002AD27526|nr:aldo/keto reductase [Dendronalium sp. ChiSLP03b]MDZ8208210.1 aldo/keto reductase [Dendronalium sp. ChiSLP03b]